MTRHSRTLVLAFDGTSNEFDQTNTNVVRLCAVLQMADRDRQMVYYQPGIGTYTAPGIRGCIQRWVAETADLAVAWYLPAHIMRGYEFLMNNHLPGDKICIFGFSRGAYTARALAGMLHCVGLLPKGNHEQVSFAYRMYSKKECDLAAKFKNTFCKSVSIDFMGVWDTVASVGFIVPKTLPFVSSDTIKTFRHSLSLDEHRTKFRATLWRPEDEVTKHKVRSGKDGVPQPSVEEMWFSGCHSDIGGGEVEDGTTPDLANVAFRWMLGEIVKSNCGILFDNANLDSFKIPTDCVPRVFTSLPTPLTPPLSNNALQAPANVESLEAPPMRSRLSSDATAVGDETAAKTKGVVEVIPSLRDADTVDAIADMHDELKLKPIWWLLQVPVWTGKRIDWTGIRKYPKDPTRKERSHIHWTVVERMKKIKGYTPTARLPDDVKESLAAQVNASSTVA